MGKSLRVGLPAMSMLLRGEFIRWEHSYGSAMVPPMTLTMLVMSTLRLRIDLMVGRLLLLILILTVVRLSIVPS